MSTNLMPQTTGIASAAPRPPQTAEVRPKPPGKSFLAWLTHAIPTAIVIAGLGGLAYWGHHTGWTMPKFSILSGKEQPEADDWCAEHGVPESICVECSPSLLPRAKEFGWCKAHGVAECPLCHPELAQLDKKPNVTPADLVRAERALASGDRPENNSKCKTHHRRIQFASAEAAEKAGIDVATAWPASMTEAIAGNGEITYDQTRVARLPSRVPGTVFWVGKAVGDEVKRGDLLALIDAAEVGKAKSELLHALALVEQKAKLLQSVESLIKSGTYPPTTNLLVEAKAALREAEIRLVAAEQGLLNLGLPIKASELRELSPQDLAKRLQFLGLPSEMAADQAYQTTTSNLFPLRATLDGVVVAREVTTGDPVTENAKPLFVIADVNQMWLTLDIRLEDTKRLALGQPVRFQADGGAKPIVGVVKWISTAVDEKTRTVKVRAELPNPDAKLRAFTFGSGRIILRDEKEVVTVPNEAVHWEGCCNIVFVRDKNYLGEEAPKVFHVRKVRIGAKDEANTEIIAGVLPGEIVAAKGSGGLRSELLKNNLGAG